jgi:hypothetical protein
VKPVLVSFFTAGTPYESEAAELAASAREFGLFPDIRPVPNLGDWARNCGMKPAFIRDRMQDYPGRPVVWLDADARVRQVPELFATLDCDFAAHWRYGVELLSGTLYFGPTRAARRLCEAWAEAQMRAPRVWDQKVLQRVIESGAPPARLERLPAAYTAIFDARMCPDDEQVIVHTQASRRLKQCLCDAPT